MIELILVRHAKSDWNVPEMSDHDRPLNARGERDAPMMAARLAETAPRVDRLISSTALRARSTAEHFSKALGVDLELDRELYLASGDGLLELAIKAGTASTAEPAKAIILVTHDPGISDLAHRLSDGAIDRMPTCGIARFTWLSDDWTTAANTPADTHSLCTPRQHVTK